MTLPDPAASRAVLIGVDEYTVLDQLPAVANDIAGLARLLTGPGSWGLPAEHRVVLSNPRTPSEVLGPVHTAAAQAKDALLVYFAGHGLRARDMDLHLALPDSRPGRLYHAVDHDDISPAGEHHTAFTGELLKAATEGVPDGPEILGMRTLLLPRTPETVTLTVRWDGGTGTCPSFALGWDDPGLDREADFNFLDPDFYPG
ncbi:caspase family protein [Streptomyces sp. NPDC088341]|uniref:caspase family protein n=1 Tax=Streptomyces sp. NPDC088341 TaxID=3154870 RepID=UPI00341D1165